MNVVHTVETRTTRPVTFRGNKGQRIHFMTNVGQGHCTKRPATAVKITALRNGNYSVRSLGKGGLPTLHLYPFSFLCMVTEDGDMVSGKVSEVFAKTAN